ncbi:MAG: hypothetical protein OXF27_13805, partial [Acidobacteria bacterium]|nr:hypothetical protein [Acidobacteriota bacterium]
TCRFLAADFDKEAWWRDANAFLEACRSKGVPAALERSRSGNGGHVWIFFAEPVPAALARRLSAHLVTATMERNPDIGFASYDRFFPSQDTVLTSGFGNLIALPLQGGNSVFLDDSFEPHADQWAFLSSLRRLSLAEATAIVEEVGAGSARLSGCVCRSTKRTTNPGARRRRGGGRCPRLPDRCRSGSTRFWATRSTSRPPVCR